MPGFEKRPVTERVTAFKWDGTSDGLISILPNLPVGVRVSLVLIVNGVQWLSSGDYLVVDGNTVRGIAGKDFEAEWMPETLPTP